MAKRKRLGAKYMLRRVFLIVLCLGLVGLGGWYAGRRGTVEPTESSSRAESGVSGEASEMPSQPPPSSDGSETGDREEGVREDDGDGGESVSASPTAEGDVDDSWRLILVNEDNPLPDSFREPELETITEHYQVDSRVAANLRRMFAQAKADGIDLMLCSAYRPVDYQQGLFDDKVLELMELGSTEEEAIATTASMIAWPGTSEHHTGLAVDVVTPNYQNLDDGFAETPAFGWLDQHAHEYGFVLRYPADKQGITGIIYEPWHYRYVGEDHAAVMKERGYCLEEYIYVRNTGGLQQQTPGDDSEDNDTPEE